MKNGVTVVTDKLAAVVAGIEALVSYRIMVGVPSDRAGRRDLAIDNAALAYIHDNGAPEVGIPARPFMLEGVNDVRDRIVEQQEHAAEAALDGKPDKVEQFYHRAGLIAQAGIRAKITRGPFVPLKPATLAARRRRGRKGTRPLIDTGQLRNAISYVIRKVGRS